MSKITERWLKKQIKQIQNEKDQYEPTEEELNMIKQRAFAEYQRRTETQDTSEKPIGKKRGLLRRVVTVAAAAASLMIISFLYSAFAPVTVSNASSFIRRASIWLNDKMHLGITFPVPEETEKPFRIDGYTTFDTVEEACKLTAPVPIFTEPNLFTAKEIYADLTDDGQEYDYILYENDEGSISFFTYPLYDISNITRNSTEYVENTYGFGSAFLTSSNDGSIGLIYREGYVISVDSSYSTSDLDSFLQSLAFN